jgi:superfamily II DNA or RNA helicase
METQMLEQHRAQTPRPYQEQALDAIANARERGVRRSLITLPTGTGKTNIFAWALKRFREAGDTRPAVIVAHREELLTQAAERIALLAPELRVGTERAEERVEPHEADVVVASVQTIGRKNSARLPWCEPGFIVLDEAHHALPHNSYGRVLERWPDAFVLGCTATPKRLDRLSLHASAEGVFEEVVFSYGIREAIADGWLCSLRGYRVKTDVDLTDLRTMAGDFEEAELARRIVTEERTQKAVDHWHEVARGRPTIAFGTNVEHAHMIADLFRRSGVPAEAVDGGMARDERRAVIKRYRSGETVVLANCMVATEGFDAPETACVVMARPTQSWGLYCQCVGRGTRLAPGKKDCLIIDLVDVTTRHSLATLPTLLDLPCGLDLEGRSISEAAEALEELGARVSFLQDFAPDTFSELETVLEEVDLFANVEPPADVQAASALAWLKVPGGLLLSCGGTGEQREAQLRQDALGDWHLRISVATATPSGPALHVLAKGRAGGSLAEALRRADAAVLDRWPEVRWLAGADARWRGDTVTTKQVNLLRKLGYEGKVVERMSKGQASGLIAQHFAGRRGGGVRERR